MGIDDVLDEGGFALEGMASIVEAPEGASDWTVEQIKERHEQIVHEEDEDILPTLFVCRGNEILIASVPENKDAMSFLIKRASDPEMDIDWAVMMSTAYQKVLEDDDELENYEEGSLADDAKSVEIHMMNVFKDGRKVMTTYNKETKEEMETHDSANEDEEVEGRMSF